MPPHSTPKVVSFIIMSLIFNVVGVHGQEWVKRPVYGKKGMVASADRIASEIGARVLRDGGNAVDAAVSVAFALAVIQPVAGNIGGGGFMLIHLAAGKTTAIDYREKAPAAAHQTMFLDEDGSIVGERRHQRHLAVGVPGTVAGLTLALEKYGSMPLPALVAPAIELAEQGFEVSYFKSLQFVKNSKHFSQHAATAKAFLHEDGTPYALGEILRQPDLAVTLKRLAADGGRDFYEGETAQLIAAEMKRHGGLITLQDLADYKAAEREPILADYRGYQVFSMPPPSGGGVTLAMMLNILEGYDLPKMGRNSAPYLHTLAEAMRRGYANRALYLGDPDFNPDMPIRKLLSKKWAAEQRKSISAEHASRSMAQSYDWPDESGETTHFSVVDRQGNMVSNTYTIEGSFGAKFVVAGAGFFLNGEMGDFNPKPGLTDSTGLIGTKPNLVAPGKRMLSSMTPVILVKDGRAVAAIGSPGGRKITNTVLQVILNIVDFDMNVYQAIDAPRVHHQWLPDVLKVEKWALGRETLAKLREMGHKVVVFDPEAGSGRAVAVAIDSETGLRTGAVDPRAPDGGAVAE